MKKLTLIIPFVLIFAIAISCGEGSNPQEKQPAGSVYDFVVKDIDGNDVALSQFQGKVVMIVNVASKCGFTPQYAGLEKIYEQFKDSGFVVLGFPANNFRQQEPGTNLEIKHFCQSNYGVTFPMFSKISVKGNDMAPLYRFLTDTTKSAFGGEITWNFNKFLIDRQGNIAARFDSRVKPTDEQLTGKIAKLLIAK